MGKRARETRRKFSVERIGNYEKWESNCHLQSFSILLNRQKNNVIFSTAGNITSEVTKRIHWFLPFICTLAPISELVRTFTGSFELLWNVFAVRSCSLNLISNHDFPVTVENYFIFDIFQVWIPSVRPLRGVLNSEFVESVSVFDGQFHGLYSLYSFENPSQNISKISPDKHSLMLNRL